MRTLAGRTTPQLGITDGDHAQYDSFFGSMEQWRDRQGGDGRRAFAIPLDESSREPEFLGLDVQTMAQFMDANGWNSPPLRWFVNYCCRDDYGAGSDRVSASAGIHYFASRNGRAGNAPREAVLTWPEGNGWLAAKLAESVAPNIRTSCAVWRIELRADAVEITYYDAAQKESVRIHAQDAICAIPASLHKRLFPGSHRPGHLNTCRG